MFSDERIIRELRYKGYKYIKTLIDRFADDDTAKSLKTIRV